MSTTSIWKHLFSRVGRAVSLIASIVLTLVLLWGPTGLLVQPDVQISCGKADLMLPSKFLADMMAMRIMFLPDAFKKVLVPEKMENRMKELGLSEEKRQRVLDALENWQGPITKEIEWGLEPYEERIIAWAMIRTMSELPGEWNPPTDIVFFEVNNRGRSGTGPINLAVRVNGKILFDTIYIDSTHHKEIEGSKCIITMDSLNPGAAIRGLLWYQGHAGEEIFEQETLLVSYDRGTKEIVLHENSFLTRY